MIPSMISHGAVTLKPNLVSSISRPDRSGAFTPIVPTTTCDITVFNYTARARAYTILAKWPESETVAMVDNPLGGRKETHGLWAWPLDTLDPGSSAVISFTVSGLSKGDWTDMEIFFRGNGDIIGATKIDEKLLDEMRNKEALDAAVEEVRIKKDPMIENLAERAEESVQVPNDEGVIDMGSLTPDQGVDE